MPLINCKVELKVKWMKLCVLASDGAENDHVNSNNLTFILKDSKLYLPVVTQSTKGNQKLSKLLTKGFKRSVHWHEYKTKSENKNSTNECPYFFESNFIGVHRLFVLVYSDPDDAKSYTAQTYFSPKCITKNYNIIISGKNFYEPINS